ncbi:BQ5605_C026g10260 [Microbotryum silenes-dioicae]|uniref:BQ5605_C026g10260 protein n=1 Tax=Microbotryum silenes-dioicae TaxID=796604 RepID=A0A2X0MN08_9BASI|nr:BQ5605_C026g10260 [Microbotryum silenes-dioicae]
MSPVQTDAQASPSFSLLLFTPCPSHLKLATSEAVVVEALMQYRSRGKSLTARFGGVTIVMAGIRRSPQLSGEVESRTAVMKRKLRNKRGARAGIGPAAGEIARALRQLRASKLPPQGGGLAGACSLRQSRAPNIDSEDGASTATEDECKDMVRGTSRCTWLEEFLQGDGSDSDGEEEKETTMTSRHRMMKRTSSISAQSIHKLSDLSPEQMLSLRCFIRALDSDMSDKQYLHLIQEASVQKGVDPRQCMSMREMAEFVQTASQLEAEWFDICIEGHVAFIGPHADQEVCGTLHKRVDTDPETTKKKTITERCTEPRFKTIRTRRSNLQ